MRPSIRPPGQPRPRGWACAFVALAAFAILGLKSIAGVVINEVMYHPPSDRDELQWIELHNASTHDVALGGWSFQKGVTFTFPQETRIPAGGFLVVARQREAFLQRYGNKIPVTGNFQGRLSHSGEKLELADAAGAPVDSLRYQDTAPWPASADGLSPSLERIAASVPATGPENWAPSPMLVTLRAGGTPGATNAAAAGAIPPVLTAPLLSEITPGQPIRIAVELADPSDTATVTAAYQTVDLGQAPQPKPRPDTNSWSEVRLQPAGQGRFSGELPPVPAHHLLRYRFTATRSDGLQRILPHPHDSRPAFSTYVGPSTNATQVPWVSILEFGPRETRGQSVQDFFQNQGQPKPKSQTANAAPARGSAVVIYTPPKGAPVQVFDFVRVTPRKSGWKLRFQKDRMLEGMSTVNVLFEEQPRQVLSEHLAFELYREAGIAAPLSGHWRVWHNGRPRGYHLFVEQINGTFLRRTGHDDQGDLYKMLWYEHGVAAQHEKKNNPDHDHKGLVQLVQRLGASRGEAQWQLIEKHFDVDSFANYFAASMCLQNWDGFFNNYFVYQAPGPDGKWEIFPWDNDKTWGDYDGASARYDWYGMPLTFGMAGDEPKNWSEWWRPGGWFSGPLLANPQFRARFRDRLQKLCTTAFSPEQMEVAIARLERRLEPEVVYRSTLTGLPPSMGPRRFKLPFTLPGTSDAPGGPAVAEFKEHIESFRRQVKHRREFLLKALAAEK